MDYTKFTIEELEELLKEHKNKLASMIMNPDITKIIGEVEILEFMIKSKKEDGQENTELN
jgi:hypothetical protein